MKQICDNLLSIIVTVLTYTQTMDRAKVFKDYFVSSQNAVLIPNEEFGRRKFINVGLGRSVSLSRIEEITKYHTEDMRSGRMNSSLCYLNLL